MNFRKSNTKKSSLIRSLLLAITILFCVCTIVPSVVYLLVYHKENYLFAENVLAIGAFDILSFIVSIWAALNIINLITKSDLQESQEQLAEQINKLESKLKYTTEDMNKNVESLKKYIEDTDETIKNNAWQILKKIIFSLEMQAKQQVSVPYIVQGFKSIDPLIESEAREILPLLQLFEKLESEFKNIIDLFRSRQEEKLVIEAENGLNSCLKCQEYLNHHLESNCFHDDLMWYIKFREIDIKWYKTYNSKEDLTEEIIQKCNDLICDILDDTFSIISMNQENQQKILLLPPYEKQVILYILNLIAEYPRKKLAKKYRSLVLTPKADHQAYWAKAAENARELCLILCNYLYMSGTNLYSKALSEMYRNMGVAEENVLFDKDSGDKYHASQFDSIFNLYKTALHLDSTVDLNYVVIVSLWVKLAERLLNTGNENGHSYYEVHKSIYSSDKSIAELSANIKEEDLQEAMRYAAKAKEYCDCAEFILPFSIIKVSIIMRTYTLLGVLYSDDSFIEKSRNIYEIAMRVYDKDDVKRNLKHQYNNLMSLINEK